ncbi:MAG: SDR family oxidoreductase [Bacillota bacterium]|nr:SDR family oxidoreductase [Bacillota bacterium]
MSRTAMITGASRGMGKAEAIEFAKAGYNVIIVYAKEDEKALETKKQCEAFGVKAIALKADLRKKEAIEALVTKAFENFDSVDVLVNNAGYALYGDVKDKTIEGFDEMMRVHLYAPFYLAKLLAPKMMERKFGRIINISSIDATKTYNAESMEYDAAKAAIINLTKNMSLAYAPYVNANCICPGWMHTDMTDSNPEGLNEYILGRISKGRFGRPEEVAKTALFLASEDAEYIDGAIIDVDGGYKLV